MSRLLRPYTRVQLYSRHLNQCQSDYFPNMGLSLLSQNPTGSIVQNQNQTHNDINGGPFPCNQIQNQNLLQYNNNSTNQSRTFSSNSANAANPSPSSSQSNNFHNIPPLSFDTSNLKRPSALILLAPPGGGKGTISKKLIDYSQRRQEVEKGQSVRRLTYIAAGDVLRNVLRSTSKFSQEELLEIKKIMDSGGLLPDSIVKRLLIEEYQKISLSSDNEFQSCDSSSSMSQNLLLLDGYPRTLQQAQGLEVPDQDIAMEQQSSETVTDSNTKTTSSTVTSDITETIPSSKSTTPTSFHIPLVLSFDVPQSEIISRLSSRWVHPGSNRIYNYLYNPPIVEGIDDITGEKLERRKDDEPETIKKRLELYEREIKDVMDYYANSNGSSGNGGRLMRFNGEKYIGTVDANDPDSKPMERSDAIVKEILENGRVREVLELD